MKEKLPYVTMLSSNPNLRSSITTSHSILRSCISLCLPPGYVLKCQLSFSTLDLNFTTLQAPKLAVFQSWQVSQSRIYGISPPSPRKLRPASSTSSRATLSPISTIPINTIARRARASRPQAQTLNVQKSPRRTSRRTGALAVSVLNRSTCHLRTQLSYLPKELLEARKQLYQRPPRSQRPEMRRRKLVSFPCPRRTPSLAMGSSISTAMLTRPPNSPIPR